MIVYIEKEILLDTQCQDLYLCNNELNDEYLIISSIDQCSCKKQHVILCKYEHDLCQNRCLLEDNLFLKQKVSHKYVYDPKTFKTIELGLFTFNIKYTPPHFSRHEYLFFL